MNISGVTQTAVAMPTLQTETMPIAPESAPSADVVNVSLAASIQVMDMAQSAFEDAAAQLIAQMTGLGQNVDITI